MTSEKAVGSSDQPLPLSPPDGFSAVERQAALVLIREGLSEDVPEGDLTTDTLVPEGVAVQGAFVPRQGGVLCGLPVVAELFRLIEPAISLRPFRTDGDRVVAGEPILGISGPVHPILLGERLALNFLQRLSGVASATNRIVEAIQHTDCEVFDTRKTTPGWRSLEKYAVRVGGGQNHRMHLSESSLVKDNHRQVLQWLGNDDPVSWVASLRAARSEARVELEVDSLDELSRALPAEPDVILLDNFSVDDLKRAVEIVKETSHRRPELEASGGISLRNARPVAETGVDRVALGALTHSAPALDIGLDLTELKGA